jgi:hypothetical protein
MDVSVGASGHRGRPTVNFAVQKVQHVAPADVTDRSMTPCRNKLPFEDALDLASLGDSGFNLVADAAGAGRSSVMTWETSLLRAV